VLVAAIRIPAWKTMNPAEFHSDFDLIMSCLTSLRPCVQSQWV
jgi:hypothetical protein